jgi:dolichol kinase
MAGYRESSDDGILTGLLFGPLITVTLLCSSLRQAGKVSNSFSLLPASWRIETPARLSSSMSVLEAVTSARYNAVNLATLCSSILLMHVCASSWFEARSRRGVNAPEGERGSVPRKEVKRSLLYILFTFSVSCGTILVRFLLAKGGLGIWQRKEHNLYNSA